MAEKKTSSRAQKAVSGVKKKNSGEVKSGKPSTQKAPAPRKNAKVKTEYEEQIPADILIAISCFALFLLFLLISIKPDGALLRVIKAFLLGLVGQAGFYFFIPSLLYLAVLHVMRKSRSVKMRSCCTIGFSLFCGALYHLVMNPQTEATGFSVIGALYQGGVTGETGGILCGGFAVLLRWACGTALSYVIVCLCTTLCLLGAMQITIPSIIRAIANRPRDDWQEDAEENYVEPAAAVVNHIASKKIEQKRQRRELAQQVPPQPTPEHPAEPLIEEKPTAVRPAAPSEHAISQPPVQQKADASKDAMKPLPGKGAAFMNRIDEEIGAPLSGTAQFIKEEIPSVFEEPTVDIQVKHEIVPEEIPVQMPELKRPVQPQTMIKEAVMEKPVSKPEAPANTAKVTAKDTAASAKEVAKEIAKTQSDHQPEVYRYPPIDLLIRPTKAGNDGTDEMRENSKRLNETLASFKIDAHIINVTRGPSVTRYEVELDKGVRLNKLTGCADDIALSLGSSGVRIAAVPGKISVVGIEVPNRVVTTVSLREVIDSDAFRKSKSKSSFAVGKDIAGNCIIGNIAKMPHLLIAGTTGSGKSVCMNSIIISLLYKSSPEQVKLIMVDPKMVELGIYNNIPHLLIPVVTDPKKAAGSLQWAVTEMLRRYKMMSDAGVRDLESYNSIIEADDGKKLPQVVIIIDELADMMMVAAKEVEDSICRIAQMGRAAGMHLIIATQRPSADVITGLMKANIPSRIAFSVASSMESRIILDTMGAEKLVGKGDMLFAPIGSGKPLRVQGCFVTDGEVEAITEYVKQTSDSDYNQQIMDDIEKRAQQTSKKPASVSDPDPNDEELDGDEMLPAAVDVILETNQASVSMLQRRLKLGYARAARIVDEMEEKGIVGPFQGSKPRAILITKEQWQAKKNGGAGAPDRGQTDVSDIDNDV